MPVIPKIAGTASAIATIYDIHKTAMIYSEKEYKKAMGDSVIASSVGNQKEQHVSHKDAQRKNWMARHHLMSYINEPIAAVKGYIIGAKEGIVRYAPKLILAAIATFPKKAAEKILSVAPFMTKAASKIPYVSAIALAGLEIWDFLKNGTGIFEKANYLKRK